MNQSSNLSPVLLSASIVTYNNEDCIKNVLNCLLQVKNLAPKNIHIIDNHSSDDTVNVIKNYFPQISLHPLGENIGFGQGHNQVLPYLNSRFHMVVNPDIEFVPDVIEDMVSYMEQNPSISLLSPKVVFSNGDEQFLPKELPSVHFLAGGFFERFGSPFTRWRAEYTWKNQNISIPTPVSFATGCFMFLSTTAYQQIGGFDKRYFLYMEDADLTREISKTGAVIYHPQYCVTHHWARESSKNFSRTKLHLKAVWKYFTKWGLKL